jgi:hypothetical protein
MLKIIIELDVTQIQNIVRLNRNSTALTLAYGATWFGLVGDIGRQFLRIAANAFSITRMSDGSACILRSKRFNHFI